MAKVTSTADLPAGDTEVREEGGPLPQSRNVLG